MESIPNGKKITSRIDPVVSLSDSAESRLRQFSILLDVPGGKVDPGGPSLASGSIFDGIVQQRRSLFIL